MSQSTNPAAPEQGTAPSRRELQSEVEEARRELGSALDELTTRLSPGYQASQLARGTRQAAADAGGLFTGQGLPDDGTHRGRNAKILLGATVAGAVAVVVLVVRAARR
ncbi:hypothetical protein GCM10023216_12490 [Isoptericola chiayiensis]|uniref:DUF3618 domain-containing protein n=1 Tax=Isoptericola chiayiensis TaxID=579446 RepID=A0ABP8YAP2_9MICO|nr:hypothetical protein [Isoptericola chiayiensis]